MRLYPSPFASSGAGGCLDLTAADTVPRELAERYESRAGGYWDAFYRRNGVAFFKDRHYLDKEWPELLTGPLVVFEVGCGVGNTLFPLLEINPHITAYACDFSPKAVELVQSHPAYAAGRATAFVADAARDPLAAPAGPVPPRTVDYATLVFVLSALAPEAMPQALASIAATLKPGTGRILFRDYARGDLAEARLANAAEGKRLSEGLYVRGDGTLCYYFSEDGLRALFATSGFVCETLLLHNRIIRNRRSGVEMPRRWVQATFRFDPLAAAAASAAASAGKVPVPVALAGQQPNKKGERQAEVSTAQRRLATARRGGSGGEGDGAACEGHSVRLMGIDWWCAVPLVPDDTTAAPVPPSAVETTSPQQQQQQQPVWQRVADLAAWLATEGALAVVEGHSLLLLPPAAVHVQAPSGNSSRNNSSGHTGQQQQQQQQEEEAAWAAAGAWAAVALLVAARQGARRACGAVVDWSDRRWGADLSSSSSSSSSRQDGEVAPPAAAMVGSQGVQEQGQGQQRERRAACLQAYASALTAGLESNAHLVVGERLCCRRLTPGDARQRARLLADAAVGRGSGSTVSSGGSREALSVEAAPVGFALVLLPIVDSAGSSSSVNGSAEEGGVAEAVAAGLLARSGGALLMGPPPLEHAVATGSNAVSTVNE